MLNPKEDQPRVLDRRDNNGTICRYSEHTHIEMHLYNFNNNKNNHLAYCIFVTHPCQSYSLHIIDPRRLSPIPVVIVAGHNP
jgi:hypothetical protein